MNKVLNDEIDRIYLINSSVKRAFFELKTVIKINQERIFIHNCVIFKSKLSDTNSNMLVIPISI